MPRPKAIKSVEQSEENIMVEAAQSEPEKPLSETSKPQSSPDGVLVLLPLG